MLLEKTWKSASAGTRGGSPDTSEAAALSRYPIRKLEHSSRNETRERVRVRVHVHVQVEVVARGCRMLARSGLHRRGKKQNGLLVVVQRQRVR